jgi:hypothetical protein
VLDQIKNGRKPKLRTKMEDSKLPTNNKADVPSEPTHQYTSEESTDIQMNSMHSSTSKTTHHFIA